MDFQTFFAALDAEQRRALATEANTSLGQLRHLAAGRKDIELGFADVIVAVSGNRVTLDELPLTDNARTQRGIREKCRPLAMKARRAAVAA
jgi:hypothetical protein